MVRRRMVWRRGWDDDGADVDDLRRPDRSGHLCVVAATAGLARRHEQDYRPQGEARETAEEPGEGCRQAAEELPTHRQEVERRQSIRQAGQRPRGPGCVTSSPDGSRGRCRRNTAQDTLMREV